VRWTYLISELAVLIVIGATLWAFLGPSGPSKPTGPPSPVDVANSWFQAVNNKDSDAAKATLVPASRSTMDWNGGDTSKWPTFNDVHCKQLADTGSAADVYCTFSPTNLPGQQRESFLSIAMQRQLSGHWLISNYGQS
jgi:hypothetical protein